MLVFALCIAVDDLELELGTVLEHDSENDNWINMKPTKSNWILHQVSTTSYHYTQS